MVPTMTKTCVFCALLAVSLALATSERAMADDMWQPTSVDGAPTGRSGHTAVWTGAEMLIWGGFPAPNGGGIYDPSSDTWGAISQIGQPAPRDSHGAVWTGTQMLIWRGSGPMVPLAMAVVMILPPIHG